MKENIKFEQDSEMLDEYDFSQGVRGKYYQQYQNRNLKPLRGVQFIIDTQGRKTGVILDWNEHQKFWHDCLNQFGFSALPYLW